MPFLKTLKGHFLYKPLFAKVLRAFLKALAGKKMPAGTRLGSAGIYHRYEAGVMFDNSFFDNYFDFVQQLKNGLFLGPVFVHVTGRTKN